MPFTTQAQVPNGSFEDWTWELGSDEPDEWITDNLMGLFFGATFATEGVGVEGASCIVLTTRELPSLGIRASVAYTGSFAEGPDGYPFTGRPELLVGQLKYAPVGTDEASISVALTRWDPVGGQRVVVGAGAHTVQAAVMDWTSFELTINYLDPAAPDTAVIMLRSSTAPSAPGSVFSVDALDFSTGAAVNGAEAQPIGTWLDAAGEQLQVRSPMTLRTLQVLDASGRVLRSVAVGGMSTTVGVRDLPAGTYLLRAFAPEGLLLRGRFVKP